MLETYELEKLVEPLLQWYSENKRILPWRKDSTPYRVWVSEIMLQQTRIEAVKPYYRRFMEKLPDIRSLAECPEDELLKLWEGLGYYSRVRNMQTAAITIMEEYGGEMPADYDAIRSLKGIGSYTAGAIASIAFGIPAPAVDGNVMRVIMRLSADDSDIMKQSSKAKVEKALKGIIPEGHAGDFTQSIMELGETICLPNGKPLCEECPLSSICLCQSSDLWEILPVKKKPAKRRIENKTVLLIKYEDEILLNKRPDQGLLAGLYEFPNSEGHLTEEEALQAASALGVIPETIESAGKAKHVFSHVEWHMQGYLIETASAPKEVSLASGLVFGKREDYPIPTAFRPFLKYL